jgi:hypothetical protein
MEERLRQNMSDSSFLQAEYSHCFEQLRYYDTRQEEILKYLVTLASAVATAQFAVFKAFEALTAGFFAAQGFMSVVVFVASLLLYLMMLQNRLYFVFMARQINAIRKHMLATEAAAFTENQLYTSTGFSAFKWSSVHALQLLGASFISSMFAGASALGLLRVAEYQHGTTAAFLVFFAVGAVELIGGALYLKTASAKSADEAIHRK